MSLFDLSVPVLAENSTNFKTAVGTVSHVDVFDLKSKECIQKLSK
jgi:hypothetical protein